MDSNDNLKQRNAGYAAFFISGICAISSSIVVSRLQGSYGFAYGMTGTLLSLMSIGNLIAGFLTGLLPTKIGTRLTVALLTTGYAIGYFAMGLTGWMGILMLAFVLVGLAKGCTLNTCTILVGNNSPDRTKGMNVMHACYALGALLCPFFISAAAMAGSFVPLFVLAAFGLILWLVFLCTQMETPPRFAQRQVAPPIPMRYARGGALDGGKAHEKAGRSNGNAVRKNETTAKSSKTAAKAQDGVPAGTKTDWSFLKSKKFWLLTGLIFCQNAAEYSVNGWMVTYFKNSGIISGNLSTYTVTVMWGATLLGRLLIAFVFPIKNACRAMIRMSLGCIVFYLGLMLVGSQIPAIVLLFAFAFSMAGMNPTAVASAGRMTSAASMGIMLPVAGIGAIVMPWIAGIISEHAGLNIGMASNIVPCIGLFVFAVLVARVREEGNS
ncbi:MAG: MFS transporter [Lachnospiraceae bacterium]|nr:MFS transporter [Lachnospiraceae bacterium]